MPRRMRSCGRTRWSPSCRHWEGAPRPRRRRPRMPEQHHLIVGPVITEKTSAAFQARKEYAFRVQSQATKPQIRAAIEALFDVTVTDVRTPVMRGKRKSYGRYVGRRPAWKKAIVTLKERGAIQAFQGREGHSTVQ